MLDQEPILAAITWTAFIIVNLILMAVGVGLSLLLREKPPESEAGDTKFDSPTAMVGRAVPHVRGKRWVKSINMLCPLYNYLWFKNSDGSYYFQFNLWAGICLYADGVKQIKAGGKIMWPAVYDSDTESADGVTDLDYTGTTYVFGGRGGEGGQAGHQKIYYGGPAQSVPTDVAAVFGSDIPAGRGIISVVFSGMPVYEGQSFYWGTTRYPKWPSYLMKNTDADVCGDTIWQQALANVGSEDDFNPIHAIREWIVDDYVGRGLSEDLIGDTFATAAQTLYDEGLGLSYVLDTAPDQLQGYIDKVCGIIEGIVYFEPTTGTFEISLFRDDYVEGDLETFDEDDFYVTTFLRPSAGSVPSRVVVKFNRRDTEDVDTAIDEDVALLEIQGGHPVIKELDYEAYICTRSVAEIVAAREQHTQSSMVVTLELTCLRTMSHLHVGSVIKIAYSPLGIVSMIIRVLTIEKGDLIDGTVVIKAREDVFGTIYTVYGDPDDPASAPVVIIVDTTSNIEYYTSSTASGKY